MRNWTRYVIGLAGSVALLVATAAPVTAGPRVASGDELAAADEYMRGYQRQIKAPGVAYAVIRGDEVVSQGVWGVDGDGRAMTAQTPFLLGSTSKSFTALAVAQLAENGRVGLDTAVSVHLPWLRLGDGITVRQLLTHTSGLPQVWSTDLTDRYDNQPGGLTRSVRDLAALRPGTGRAYEYSDANYLILGAIVESVTGETFGGYLRRHVLDPLRMTHSAATAGETPVPAGHRYYFGRPRRFAAPFDTAGVPYGFLAASLDDLTHYAMAQLNNGSYGGARILGAEGVRQMHTGTADTGHGTYGFGWQNSTLDGVGARMVWHAGATPDYFTHLVLVPGSDLAVIVMANVYGLSMDGPLSAGAFNVVRILHGGAPAVAEADPVQGWVLGGLLGVAAGLLAALGWSGFRLARPRARNWTIAWVGGCAAVAVGAGWGVPSLFQGAGPAKVQLWAPDIGHAIVGVVALSVALALTRLGIGMRGRTAG